MLQPKRYNTIRVKLSDVEQPAAEIEGVIIPLSLVSDPRMQAWLPLVKSIQTLVGDRVLVTSLTNSFDGTPREGTSHPNGWAIDITLPDRIVQGINPHFENDIYLMTYLSHLVSGPVMIAFESDHIHIEVSDVIKGVFRYPTSRPYYYTNDKHVSPRHVSDEKLWLVRPDSISLVKDDLPLIAQRKATQTPLPLEALLRKLRQVSLSTK